MPQVQPVIEYRPAATIDRFQQDDFSFVKALRGPVGSGKSVGCTIECFKLMQEANTNTRSAVIRNTFPQLRQTTLNTWLDWLRPYGEFRYSDFTWKMKHGEFEHEVIFTALDRPGDIAKLLSLELTWAWVNEAREIEWPIIEMLTTRVGRYPPQRDGGPTWFGILMDTNSPDDMSAWYETFEIKRPDGWTQYVQPSGRGEDAENTENLVPGYYDRIADGKDAAWVKVYVDGEYGFIVEGRPVYPQWKDPLHAMACHKDPSLPLLIGIDFGLTPAACFVQRSVTGQYRVIEELVTTEMSAVEFADELGRILRSKYKDHEVEIYGDPAGEQRSQVDKRTPFQILKAASINARPAPTNDPRLRVEAVVRNLTRLTMAGDPGIVVDPRCRYLRRGMAGGYKFRRMQIVGEERYAELPEKNIYSHVCEALQYALCGAGEVRSVMGRKKQKPLDYNRMDRRVV